LHGLYIYCVCCGRDLMVVGFTTTYAINAYRHWCCEFESSSWQGLLNTTLCDKVCQWLRSVVFSMYSCLLHLYNWQPRYNWNIVESGVKHHYSYPPLCLLVRKNMEVNMRDYSTLHLDMRDYSTLHLDMRDYSTLHLDINSNKGTVLLLLFNIS
jgi:hypothetical protein